MQIEFKPIKPLPEELRSSYYQNAKPFDPAEPENPSPSLPSSSAPDQEFSGKAVPADDALLVMTLLQNLEGRLNNSMLKIEKRMASVEHKMAKLEAKIEGLPEYKEIEARMMKKLRSMNSFQFQTARYQMEKKLREELNLAPQKEAEPLILNFDDLLKVDDDVVDPVQSILDQLGEGPGEMFCEPPTIAHKEVKPDDEPVQHDATKEVAIEAPPQSVQHDATKEVAPEAPPQSVQEEAVNDEPTNEPRLEEVQEEEKIQQSQRSRSKRARYPGPSKSSPYTDPTKTKKAKLNQAKLLTTAAALPVPLTPLPVPKPSATPSSDSEYDPAKEKEVESFLRLNKKAWKSVCLEAISELLERISGESLNDLRTGWLANEVLEFTY